MGMKFSFRVFSKTVITKKINHQHKLLLVGSCFTENIGDKLVAHKLFSVTKP